MSLNLQFVIVFAVLWIGLLRTARKPNIWKWSLMHLGTAGAVLYSADHLRRLQSLPGEGLLPWMTNLREEIAVLAALTAFTVLFCVTVILHIVFCRRTSYCLRFWKRPHCTEDTARFAVIKPGEIA